MEIPSELEIKVETMQEQNDMFYLVANAFLFFLTMASYIALDRFLRPYCEGRYYLLHSMNNLSVVLTTYPAISYTFNNLYTFYEYPFDWRASIVTGALHGYHIIEYHKKFTYYDYLHHGTMCFIALPIGIYINSGSMLDFSLFFICGLPGLIDYFLLFLVRNNWMDRMTEKKWNNSINLWLRCPGCISISTLIATAIMNVEPGIFTNIEVFLIYLIIFLNYWNGVYFMKLVVSDYAKQKYIEECKLHI